MSALQELMRWRTALEDTLVKIDNYDFVVD